MAPDLFVATPAYGGMISVHYANGLLRLVMALQTAGVPVRWSFLGNESLITRARNNMVAMFLESPCSHLMFIDADIGFSPNDVLPMLTSGLDLVAGGYPQKAIDWEQVGRAARAGCPPLALPAAGAIYAFNVHEADITEGPIRTLRPADGVFVEVKEASTGFMLIARPVLEKMIAAYPETAYQTDHVGHGGAPRHALFDCVIDPEEKRYLSEDYTFCRRWRKLGGKIHLYTCANLSHLGSYAFAGNVGELFAPKAG